MARNVILSTLARMDLNDIADYTLERWGEDQALAYQQKLIDRINWIARNPQKGRLREDLLEDMFCFREGRVLRNRPDYDVDGVNFTVHGHTPLDRPTWVGNRYFMDTGAGHGEALTLRKIDDIWAEYRQMKSL